MVPKSFALLIAVIAAWAILGCTAILKAQNPAEQPSGSGSGAGAEYDRRLELLTAKLDSVLQLQKESQLQLDELRSEIANLRQQLAEKDGNDDAARTVESLRASVDEIKDTTEVLQSEVKQHDQTKVESASKLPLRISGAMLFTSVLNSGNADNVDVPMVAIASQPDSPHGSLSATARQTILGIDASGLTLWGAKSSADLNVDFFGDATQSSYTSVAGNVRLRTAHASLEWPNRSLSLRLDRPLISPLEPTSWVTRGEPALAWSGNLWAWAPQLTFKENSILLDRRLSAEIGIIDPAAPRVALQSGYTGPNSSEQSRQPGYEVRLGNQIPFGDREAHVGVGGYYSRQAYSYDRDLDAWAGTADWDLPLFRAATFSGEFYRGRGIGGLGGGAFKDYVTYNNGSDLDGVDAEGGWAQLKFNLSRSLELNLASGEDNAFAGDLRSSDLSSIPITNSYANLARNQSAFGNLVFRPRSYLLFSTEFRQLNSWPIAGSASREHIVGLAAGYLF